MKLNYFFVLAASGFAVSMRFAFLTAFLCFLTKVSFAVAVFAATGFTFAKAPVPRTSNANINTFLMISKILN